MTDRLNALFVILDRDIRDDDAQPLIDAIKQLRGVVDVQVNVATPTDAIAATRVKIQLQQKIFDVLK